MYTSARKDVPKIAWKGFLLLATLTLAIISPDVLLTVFTYNIFSLQFFHILWSIVILILIKRFIPALNPKPSLGKIYSRNYAAAGDNSVSKQHKLKEFKEKMNRGAIRVAVYWTVLVLIIGVLYYTRIINMLALFIIVIFFIFMDQFCISVWCPFQWIIDNKCCTTCRINNWGYLMAFSPLIFIPSFWTYSIIGLSVIAIIQWEYIFYRHPERFYELFNANLMCKHCTMQCSRVRTRRSTHARETG